MSLLLIIIGFVILIYGANFLVDGAASLAKRLNVPNIVIGLTIVAFGTSAPELIVNIFASIKGNSEIALGNIIGSDILNILIILGISAIFYPLSVKSNTTWIEIPLSLLAAILVLITANDAFIDGAEGSFISRIDGIIFLLFFVIFIVYNAQLVKKGNYEEEVDTKDYTVKKSTIFIVFGLIMLVVGGKLIVDSAINLARLLKISERIISLTIVSLGTSLPELATSIVAARKKNVDLAIGNVVGSNIFNVFFVLGISATINPIAVYKENNIDMLVNILASLLLFLFIFTGKGRKIDRREGIILLLIYLGYLAFLLLFR